MLAHGARDPRFHVSFSELAEVRRRRGSVVCNGLGELSRLAIVNERTPEPVTTLMRIDSETPLHGVLESAPSAKVINVPADDAAVRAILTFRAKDGRFCREFEILAASGGSTGIACRDHGEWRAEVLLNVAATPPNGNYYTPAGQSDEPAVAEVAERLIQGRSAQCPGRGEPPRQRLAGNPESMSHRGRTPLLRISLLALMAAAPAGALDYQAGEVDIEVLLAASVQGATFKTGRTAKATRIAVSRLRAG